MLDPTQADSAAIWSHQYDPRDAEVLAAGVEPECLRVYYSRGNNQSLFVAGRITASDAVPPEGLSIYCVPGGLRAEFTCGFPATGSTWQAIYRQRLPEQTQLKTDITHPSCEVCPPDALDGGAIRICIPVAKC